MRITWYGYHDIQMHIQLIQSLYQQCFTIYPTIIYQSLHEIQKWPKSSYSHNRHTETYICYMCLYTCTHAISSEFTPSLELLRIEDFKAIKIIVETHFFGLDG